MFFKTLRHDLDSGIRKRWFIYLIVAVGTLAFCQVGFMKMQNIQHQLGVSSGTWGDYLAFLFQGMKVYEPSPDNPFLFPVMWILIFLFASYSVLGYPFEDLTNYGQQVLIRCGSRRKWWLSKCAWNILNTMLYFGVIYGITIFFCFLEAAPITLEITPTLLQPLLGISNVLPIGSTEGLLLLGFPLIVTIALNLLEMVLGLFVRPFTSFGIVAALLIISAYYDSGMAIGNYTMFLRSKWVLGEAGVEPVTGFLYSAGIFFLSVAVGYFYFNRYDILNLSRE